jgi:hypothetical protein
MESNVVIVALAVSCVGLFWWGRSARKELAGDCINYSVVSERQLEMHQQMTISLAERVHLDPAVREALRHQVRVLKSIGVAQEGVIDVSPSRVELEAFGPRADGGRPLLDRPKVDLDEWQKQRGFGLASMGFVERDAETGG